MSGGLRARASSAHLRAYRRPASAEINLSDNTNRWGTPPGALAALSRHTPSLSGYPEPYAESLKEAIAEYLGVTAANITTGCGSDGVLDVLMRAFAEPGDRVAIPEPAFPMAAFFASANGLVPALVPLDGACQPDVESIAGLRPRIVYLCSPNNPLGLPCDPELVADIARTTTALVVVDEAYAEYAGTTVVPLIAELRNLVVVRTMSKAFGLAGARVGYAIGNPDVIADMERVRGPFHVNAVGAAAAEAALREGRGWMREHAALAVSERDYLAGQLRGFGLFPMDSRANFLLLPLRDAFAIARRMVAHGVAVRAFSGLRQVSAPLMASGGNAVRITVGPRDEMDAALVALTRAMAELAR